MRALKVARSWLAALTTAKDGSTPDCIRIGGILLGTQFLALSGWDVIVKGNGFDAMAYGGGAAALLAAIGAALRLKSPSEAGDD